MIAQGLYSLLSASQGGDAVDTYVAGRIFAGAAPDDLTQYPCIAYSFVGGASEPALTSSGVVRQRVEVNAFAVMPDVVNSLQPYDVAGKIRMAIIKRINGWQQNSVGGDATNVLDASLLNPGTDFVTEDRIFRCLCEFYVLYTLPS